MSVAGATTFSSLANVCAVVPRTKARRFFYHGTSRAWFSRVKREKLLLEGFIGLHKNTKAEFCQPNESKQSNESIMADYYSDEEVVSEEEEEVVVPKKGKRTKKWKVST